MDARKDLAERIKQMRNADIIQYRHTLSQVAIGNSCPSCASKFIHDCEFEPNSVLTPDPCFMSKALDDWLIGHCDNCNTVWCATCKTVFPKMNVAGIKKAVSKHREDC